MLEAKLVIHPQAAERPEQQCFDLIGTIDVDATTLLQSLYQLPSGCNQVVLNFAQIQRVNSMGLAQLLKLFECWQAQQVDIKVANANRMIGVLFKMTGLAGYLLGNSPQAAPVAPAASPAPTPTAQVPLAVAPLLNPTAAARSELPTPQSRSELGLQSAGQATAGASRDAGKLKLWVSVQSSQQMHGWYFFNTYLQRQLQRDIHMELVHGPFNDSHLLDTQMDIVFSKPFESIQLVLQQQFLPLMRPSEQSDEVTLLVRADDVRHSLLAFKGGRVVTATQANFVYLLGRFLLEDDEAALVNMNYSFAGCDIKSLQSLIKGSADIMFLLSESYRGLSAMTKSKLRVVDQSETQFAFHLLSLAPRCRELAPVIEKILLDMSISSQGRQVLADLGINGWSKPTEDEINMLAMLYRRYSLIGQ